MAQRFMQHRLAPKGKLLDRFLPYLDSYHLIIDIETEHTDASKPGVVLSVGMVTIGPDHYSHEYFTINREESINRGFASDDKVVEWLNTLPSAVRNAAYDNPLYIAEAIKTIEEYISKILAIGDCKMLYVVGNDPGFDQAFINHYFADQGIPTPFEWYQNRDFRTLAGLQLITFQERDQIKAELSNSAPYMSDHHALFDAMLEAKIWVRTISRLEELKDLENQVQSMIALQSNSSE